MAEDEKRFKPEVTRLSRNRIPRRLQRVFNLHDLEAAAHSFLPEPIFGYIAGASEDGKSAGSNRTDFERIGLVPRVLGGHAIRNQKVRLFGRQYDHPFGIAPMGLSALAAYDGDVTLARAAQARGTLAILSATSLTALERVREEAGSDWFQAYFPGDGERVVAMTRRIAAAGFETLVVTGDVALAGNRETDLRNGFATPLSPTFRLAWQGITRPAWLLGTALRTLAVRGMPHFENLDVDRGPPILARNLARSFAGRERLNWDLVKLARDHWKGSFVLKGVLAPEDAEQALRIGCDGIIVSNHGGRQLDGAISPIAALSRIIPAAGAMTVMLDSGVRRGTDVLKAFALGAAFCFVGRPMLYAAAIAQEAGVKYAIDTLSAEIDRNMALLGVSDISAIQGFTVDLQRPSP